MDREAGYCDECGADMRGFDAWLTIDGRSVCITCATDVGRESVRVPAKPEARDDGR